MWSDDFNGNGSIESDLRALVHCAHRAAPEQRLEAQAVGIKSNKWVIRHAGETRGRDPVNSGAGSNSRTQSNEKPPWIDSRPAEPEPKVHDQLSRAGMLLQGFAGESRESPAATSLREKVQVVDTQPGRTETKGLFSSQSEICLCP